MQVYISLELRFDILALALGLADRVMTCSHQFSKASRHYLKVLQMPREGHKEAHLPEMDLECSDPLSRPEIRLFQNTIITYTIIMVTRGVTAGVMDHQALDRFSQQPVSFNEDLDLTTSKVKMLQSE